MSSTVAARLRQARSLNGISAGEVSVLAGRPRTQLALIEAREQEVVRPDILRAFADVLGVSLSWLTCGEGDAPTKETVTAAVECARAARSAPGAQPTAGDFTVNPKAA